MIAILSANIAERADHINGGTGGQDLGDTAVRIWVPGARQSRAGVKRGEVVPRLKIRKPDLCEKTSDINSVAVNSHTVDLPEGGGIEGGGGPSDRIQAGDLETLLPADVRELAGNDKLFSGERHAPNGGIGVWVPVCWRSRRGVERGDTIARESSRIGKASAGIDDAVGRHQRIHRVIGGRIPVQNRAGARVQRAQSASWLAVDLNE